MRHVFRGTKLGWNEEQEAIWFDADYYTVDEAWAQFTEYQGVTQRGYDYTGYEYDGQKYHDVIFLGTFEDDEMPHNNYEYIDYVLNKKRQE